jgi:hypothetical protein
MVHSKEGSGAKFTVVLPVAGVGPDGDTVDASPSEPLSIAA